MLNVKKAQVLRLRLTPSSQSNKGAVMLEYAIGFAVCGLIIAFILHAGTALYQRSYVNDQAAKLTRHLATDLGTNWANGTISADPWNNNCNDYIRSSGNDFFLENGLSGSSMSDPSAKYYFGATLDDSTAFIADPSSPYGILRIEGTIPSSLAMGRFFLPQFFTIESSAVVEYHSTLCSDY